MSEEDKKLQKEFKEMEKAYKNMFDNITLEQFKQIKEQVTKKIKSKDKEIDEILDKLSNRKSETLIQGLRECQLKDIEHPFITKEEYIDKILNYIKDLQQKVEQLENIRKEAIEYIENTDDFDIEIFDESTGGCLGADISKGAKNLLNILSKGSNKK